MYVCMCVYMYVCTRFRVFEVVRVVSMGPMWSSVVISHILNLVRLSCVVSNVTRRVVPTVLLHQQQLVPTDAVVMSPPVR